MKLLNMPNDYTNLDKNLLFKFTPFNLFALETIVNNTLYFCKPYLLNDPLDCQFEIQIINPENFNDRTVDFIKTKRPFLNQKLSFMSKNILLNKNQELQKEFINEFFNFDINENHGICSFSLTAEENLLWSHYADKAKGICIVFNKEKLINSINDYLKNTYFSCHHDFVRYKGVKKMTFKLTKKMGFSYTQKHFYSKTKHWSYEKEYRIVLNKKYKEWFQPKYPYEFAHTIPFKKESIHSIILGEKIEPANALMIEKIIQNLNLNITLAKHKFNNIK